VNDQISFPGSGSWSPTSVTTQPIFGLPPGYALLTVFANRIPSTAQVVLIAKAPTTVTASGATAAATAGGVTLSARVVASGSTPPIVSEGSVTFTVLQSGTTIGTPTSASVANGAASGSYALPSGLATGSYTIQAAYGGGADFAPSSDSSQVLTITTGSYQIFLPFLPRQ
jgi:hypothetical protein